MLRLAFLLALILIGGAAGPLPAVNTDLSCSSGQAVIYTGSAVQCGAVDLTTSTATLPAAQLPNPSASTLGGVQSIATASHNFMTGISTSGVPSKSQPACADLSDAAASCSTNTTSATNITSGTLANARLASLNGYHSISLASGANAITLVSDSAPGTVSHYIAANAGETSVVFTMPATPGPDGQLVCMSNSTSSAVNTSLSFVANAGQSLAGTAVTSLSAQTPSAGGSRFCWVWLLGTTTWQRVQ